MKPLNNIDKPLESKDGKSLRADLEKIEFDVQQDLLRALKEMYENEKTKGQSFSDWLKRTPKEELLKLELSGGGKVIMLSDYLKQKRKPPIKKIDLAQGDFEKTVAGLSSADKDIIKDLLRKSGIKVSD